MAITRPDIYEHNNPLNAIVDSNFTRGGIRSAVNTLTELYQIGSGVNDKVDQLKQHSTKVYVSGEGKFYILKDISNRTNLSGWEPESNILGENIVYTTGDQTISGQKWFVYDDPTITQFPFNNNYANLVIVEGYGPAVPKFKALTEYRPYTFGQPNYYYSGIGYETGSVQIYFDTGDSRWKYYFGGSASQYFIAKSPVVTPNNFEADFPLKGWTDNLNQIVDIKFSPQVTHNESHASGQRDALDPNSIGAVALTGNQSIFGIKAFVSRPTVNGTGVLLSGEAAQVDLSSTVRTTGDQTVSGIKTFVNNQTFSGNINVSGTGIFNALDLNNIDNLSLSGINITITSGSVSLTNRPTVNGTGVLLSGEVAALPTTIVYTTGTQTISGTKIFVGSLGIGDSANPSNNKLFLYNSGLNDYVFIQSYRSNGNAFFEFNDQLGNTTSINLNNKTISGNGNSSINFSARPTVNGTGILLSGEATAGGGSVSGAVYTTGDQIISGNKTFVDNLIISGTGFFQNINISNLSELNISGARINVSGSSGVYLNTDLQVNRSGTFTSGINLQNSQIINAVPQLINVSSNFNITGIYNTRLILANSPSQITGTIVSGNSIGFNVSINQVGTGQIIITGSGLGISISSYGGQYKTAGQYAAISLVHTGNNGYLMYGNTAL